MDERKKLRDFLNKKVEEYNKPQFIKDDPICIPHLFTKKQDIEIAGFFASIFAWGNRTIIINKSRELMKLMDGAPHDFILHHTEADLKKLLHFKHRTFNTTDLLYFVEFLSHHYRQHESLESAFLVYADKITPQKGGGMAEAMLISFHHYFFSLEFVPPRTRKHIATPEKNSNCKRLNMFLRWMVRRDNNGVDFGIWKNIDPSVLICPVDLHVARVAKRFNLLQQKQINWTAAVELTRYLKELDPADPVKYDFALFGLGVIEKFV